MQTYTWTGIYMPQGRPPATPLVCPFCGAKDQQRDEGACDTCGCSPCPSCGSPCGPGMGCSARFPDGRWVRYCLGCEPVGPHRKAGY